MEIVKIIMLLALACAAGWALWRGFIFVYMLFKPMRDLIKPVNDHVDTTLRKSGLGALADAAKGFQKGIDGAVKGTLDGIDERKKKDHEKT